MSSTLDVQVVGLRLEMPGESLLCEMDDLFIFSPGFCRFNC